MELQLPLPQDGLRHQRMQRGLRFLIDPYLSCPDDTIREHHCRSAYTVKVRKNPTNIVESAATESSQPRTYISPRVSQASKPIPLTNPTSLPLQTNAECLCLALEQSYSPLEDIKRVEMAIMSRSRMSCMCPAGCAMFSPIYTSSKPPQPLSVPGRTLVLLS